MSEPSENMTRDLNYLLNRPRSSSGGAAEAKCTTCAKVEGECRCPEPTFLVFDYPAAARSLMTSLAEFCDDSLPPSEQIAEAGRRARREIESLRARLSFPAVPHAASPAAGPGAPSGEKPSERIACGASHPDPEVEARLVALREAENAPPDTAGCGRRGVWTYMYRCVECGVAEVVGGSEDYGVPDPERIHTIDDGDYQGTLVFVIAA